MFEPGDYNRAKGSVIVGFGNYFTRAPAATPGRQRSGEKVRAGQNYPAAGPGRGRELHCEVLELKGTWRAMGVCVDHAERVVGAIEGIAHDRTVKASAFKVRRGVVAIPVWPRGSKRAQARTVWAAMRGANSPT